MFFRFFSGSEYLKNMLAFGALSINVKFWFCSDPVLHPSNWKHFYVVLIWYGLTVIVSKGKKLAHLI